MFSIAFWDKIYTKWWVANNSFIPDLHLGLLTYHYWLVIVFSLSLSYLALQLTSIANRAASVWRLKWGEKHFEEESLLTPLCCMSTVLPCKHLSTPSGGLLWRKYPEVSCPVITLPVQSSVHVLSQVEVSLSATSKSSPRFKRSATSVWPFSTQVEWL